MTNRYKIRLTFWNVLFTRFAYDSYVFFKGGGPNGRIWSLYHVNLESFQLNIDAEIDLVSLKSTRQKSRERLTLSIITENDS